MKDKILTLIIGILIGAVITAAGFVIYSKVNGNDTEGGRGEGMQQMDGNFTGGGGRKMDGNMTAPDGEMPDGEAPGGESGETSTTEETS